jgi:hypothetical protein
MLVGEAFPGKITFEDLLQSEITAWWRRWSRREFPVIYDFTSMRSQLVAGDVVTILCSIPRKVLFAEADRRMTENLTVGWG